MNSSGKTYLFNNDTICAPATPPGPGAIAVIRISGQDSFSVCDNIFKSKKLNFKLSEAETHTIHFGIIHENDNILDEVLVSVFRKPNSYTGENSIEISCHGSDYIQQKIIELLIKNGVRFVLPHNSRVDGGNLKDINFNEFIEK